MKAGDATSSKSAGFAAKFILAIALNLALSEMVPILAWAEEVALKDVPPLPTGTHLFTSEAKFAFRGRVGGYAMKPSRYGVYYDKRVHIEGYT